MRRKLLGAAVAVGIAGGFLAGPVSADPVNAKNNFGVFPLVCDNGQTYQVVVNGNGNFTPAHDVNSTSVFVPVSFGGTTVTSGGTTQTFPGSTKGEAARGNKNLVTCTFTITFTDPTTGQTGTSTGSVVGFVTPNGGN